MSTDLVALFGTPELAPVATTELQKEISQGGFLPAVRLSQKLTQQVTDKIVEEGQICFVQGQKWTPLGESVLVVPLAYRIKAVSQELDPKNGLSWKTHFHPTPRFMEVKSLCDSSPGSRTQFWGPEFLIWLPCKNTFASLMLSTKTLKPLFEPLKNSPSDTFGVVPAIHSLSPAVASKGTNSWFVLTSEIVKVELDNAPSTEASQAQIKKFLDEAKLGTIVESGDARE